MGLSFKDMKIALDVAVKANHVPNIVGLQGIGKSDLVREFSKERGYAFREVTCSLIQEGDLAMPYIAKNDCGYQKVCYAINTIISELSKEAKNSEYAILFLDEFNRSSPQVQSELMNLVLQREIVGYKLDDNIRVVLAMNPNSSMSGYENTEYSVSYSDSAMIGRVVSLDLQPILSDWLEYGRQIGKNGIQVVHETVLGFLSMNKNFFITEENAGNINNTPRGWSRVSDLVYSYESMGIKNDIVLKNLIAGTIEKVSADSFIRYYNSSQKGVDFSKVAFAIIAGTGSVQVADLNDAELDKVFQFMVEMIYSKGGLSDEEETNFVNYITGVSTGLSYSWVKVLEERHIELYEALISNSNFSKYVIDMLNSVTVVKKTGGGFSGK